MKQEEKQLLIKDLCARLPYGTWVQYEGKEWLVTGYGHGRVSLLPSVFSSIGGPCPLVEEIKPYLRPMSSMTKEERKNMGIAIQKDRIEPWGEIKNSGEDNLLLCACKQSCNFQDWLNERHFDFRRLIEKGLALEAPEGMYK